MTVFGKQPHHGYLTLIWVCVSQGYFNPPCWFPLNKSETVKAETLAFDGIQ